MAKRIPWEFSDSPLINVWLWNTPHFEARIFAEGGTNDRRAYSWKIVDKTQGQEVPFDSNMTASFADAETELLEIIGKSYDPKLGYRKYAGPLATTFTLADGSRFDFDPIEGAQVMVSYLDTAGVEKLAIGSIQIDHYDILVVIEAANGIRLPPNKILDIRDEFSSISYIEQKRSEKQFKTSAKRTIFYTPWTPGCTGRAGLLPNTVIHSRSDAFCPVHNV